jgi:hypothetical protein
VAPRADLPEANNRNGLGWLTCTSAPSDIKGISGEVSNLKAPESHTHRALGLPGSAVGDDTLASATCNQLPNCAIGLSQTEIEHVAKGRDIGNKPNRFQAVTVGQFADMAGVCLRTIRYWQRAGSLPRRYRMNRKYVWHIDDVNLWLKTFRWSGAGR